MALPLKCCVLHITSVRQGHTHARMLLTETLKLCGLSCITKINPSLFDNAAICLRWSQRPSQTVQLDCATRLCWSIACAIWVKVWSQPVRLTASGLSHSIYRNMSTRAQVHHLHLLTLATFLYFTKAQMTQSFVFSLKVRLDYCVT